MPAITASPALSRLRILDLTRVRAGPTCVRQFADFGADVIKIENTAPEDMGGPRDGPDFQNLHRNKRSITLDLKSPQGKDIFMQLVKTADVVVENYRPDVKDRLGIDYESLKKVNKRIILASISGFGQDGPYRARPGFDQIAQGLSGIMSVTGKPGEGPMRVGCAVADVGARAARGARHHDRAARARDLGRRPVGAVQPAAGRRSSCSTSRRRATPCRAKCPTQVGNDHPTSMPTSAYATADGHINVAAAGNKMWRIVCECDRPARPGRAPATSRTAEDRAKNRKALNAEMTRQPGDEDQRRVGRDLQQGGRALRPDLPHGPGVRRSAGEAHAGARPKCTHTKLGKLRPHQPAGEALAHAGEARRGDARARRAYGGGSCWNWVSDSEEVEKLKSEGIV